MFKIFAIVLPLAIVGNCQLLREEEQRPTRYVLPYSGLSGEEQDVEEKHYYKPNRRAERIPATAYQYDEEEEYYRPQPQPQSRQKEESDVYSRYQPTTPSHKDYEEILKRNHLARLRVAAKKQTRPPPPPPPPQQPPTQPAHSQQPVEQYLKEVNPTTKTAAYQRPTNYLRFNGQSALKQEQNEETPLKQQSYRYLVQPELQQQKSYQQYQYETTQEPAKSKTPHFNIVAYQNALIAQQKLLAAENQEGQSKSAIYVSQNIAKKTKKPKTAPRQSSTQQYDYYPQVPPQRPTYTPEAASARYQQPLTPRNPYPKNEAAFQVEDPLLYPEQKELEYQTQPPLRAPKQRTTRPPRRKPKYQTEEPLEEEQPQPLPKYQQDDQYDYHPSSLKYQDEPAYRRPLPRPTKPTKYEEPADLKDDYLYQPLPKYQRENLPRRQPQYAPEPEDRRPSRYLSRQQYQEESKQLPQYQSTDLAYQPTADVPVRQYGRGASVSYRQTYPQYQYDRRQQFITPVHPQTRQFNSVEYQNALIAEQLEEESSIYITNKPLHVNTQKIYPSTQYNHHTGSQRQTNNLKLTPVRYEQIERSSGYEVEEAPEDTEQYNDIPVSKYQDVVEIPTTGLVSVTEIAPVAKFNPQRIIKKKGLHYPRRPKRPTYLNGQMFREKVSPPRIYQPEDLATQSSSNALVRYDNNQPFLILVYDE